MFEYNASEWQFFQKNLYLDHECGIMLDLSRICAEQDFWNTITPLLEQAQTEMHSLEKGALNNLQAGHFWLRTPKLAPQHKITADIIATQKKISAFTLQVHNGILQGEKEAVFTNLLVIGIGGSCQGARFISRALSYKAHKLRLFFLDNTDPQGMAELFAIIQPSLAQTLVAVISKSGRSIETINSMLETKDLFQAQGLDFARHMISVSTIGSALDIRSKAEGWLANFSIPEWLSGRFSLSSASGLLPLALQGVDIEAMLKAMAVMDKQTRHNNPQQNPAALLAGAMYNLTKGQNHSQLVLLPYRDNLEYFTAYLQQLLMESLGKEYDRKGRRVCQGLTVYGNKGSSDQHSYLQQVLAGPDDFCVVFVEVLNNDFGKLGGASCSGEDLETSFLTTRRLLSTLGRKSITITLPKIEAASLGALVALWERSVGIYAAMLNINAYDQPAVEQLKQGFSSLSELKDCLKAHLIAHPERAFTLNQLREVLDTPIEQEYLFKWLRYFVSNSNSSIHTLPGASIWEDRYYYLPKERKPEDE
ncbi:MAG: glucose-6-phosphate isomerase [Firmicutes bacterium]|nr:glucose-6-phosphate isomerase [Bacillota bacterium]